MKNVMIKWSTNWADEMDIEGFSIVSNNVANKIKETLQESRKEYTICIGTNEEIEYENGNEFLNELEFIELSEDEAQAILKITGGEFGFTQFMYKFEEIEEDE